MGVSAGTYICCTAQGQGRQQPGDRRDRRHRLAAADPGPQSKGFADALKACGLKVSNRVAAEFTVESGEKAAPTCCRPRRKIDAIWNHDDDQGVGVLAAIKHAGRDEFFMVGGAGSANAMRAIKADNARAQGDGHLPADPGGRRRSSWPACIAQDKGMCDLVEVEVPALDRARRAVVTKDNVDQYIDIAFES